MARLALLLATVAVLLVPAATALAQDGGAALSPVGDDDAFPERSWVLTLPEGESARPNQVSLRENGQAVRDLDVVPADAARRTFGVVLVLDASKSMQGRPIEDAMEAARAFAARRPGGQALGVVTFNGRVQTVLRPTTDGGRIAAALAGPPALAPDTAIRDGVAQALRLLRESQVETGSVVVLSDGSDTASKLTTPQVATAAQRQGVRIFSVGLESGAFAPGALKALAERSGGTYSLAGSSRSLRRVFDDLGTRLARELLITYRSAEPATTTIDVLARTSTGIEATATYRAPALRLPAPPPPAQEGFWVSTRGIAVTAMVIGLLLAIAMTVVARRPRAARLVERIAPFGAITSTSGDGSWDGSERSGSLLARPYERLQQRLSRSPRWRRFEEEVDVARVGLTPMKLASRTALGAVVALLLPVALGAGPLVGMLLAVLVILGARAYRRFRLRRQRGAFADQLPQSLQVMASAMRAGHSLTGALASVVQNAPEPSQTEFKRVRADEQLGVPVEECIDRMARRMDNSDLRQVGIVAALQQETGGNTAEILDRVVESVRERADLRRLVSTLTAQGRMGHVIVTALPIGLAAYFFVVNRPYLQPLFEPGPGRFLMGAAVVMVVLGSYSIRKIVDIKV
jgi:tight adherence protein B